MSAPLRVLRKAVIERRRLYLDYSCWLEEAEELTDFQSEVAPYSVEAPVVVDTVYADATNKKLMVYVSGGVANVAYVLAMLVQTSAGQVKRDELGLRVTP